MPDTRTLVLPIHFSLLVFPHAYMSVVTYSSCTEQKSCLVCLCCVWCAYIVSGVFVKCQGYVIFLMQKKTHFYTERAEFRHSA